MNVPAWMIITLDILIFVVLAVVVIFVKGWWTVRQTRSKIIAEIWEPSGDTPRKLVKPDSTGATITVDNQVYRLPKEISDEELKALQEKKVHVYPRKRWATVKNFPFTPIQLRIESWERDNPEPVRPFYGRVNEKGQFVDSLLTVTSTEWQAQKSVIQATGIAMSVQEREAREKEWQQAMSNLPNKMIVYIGLGIAALGSIVAIVLIYQIGN